MNKHHLRYYTSLLCGLIIQLCVHAQVNTKLYRDNIFDKYALKQVYQFKEGRTYYIIEWDSAPPKDIKIIRQLDERTAIVELKSPQAFGLLQATRIAEANDKWKLSPPAERLMKNMNREHPFIISSFNTDTLLN